MALKKVALRKLEDGIPNQALREIKALQEIEDNPYVSVFKTLKDLAFFFFKYTYFWFKNFPSLQNEKVLV